MKREMSRAIRIKIWRKHARVDDFEETVIPEANLHKVNAYQLIALVSNGTYAKVEIEGA